MQRLAPGNLVLLAAGLSPAPMSPNVGSNWPQGRIFSIAHRGGIIPEVPENTLSAFRAVISQGVDAIEIDLRGTKDGEIVIMHDKTVDRTTNGQGKVAEQTLAELKRLDAGNGEQVPTYEEVLQLAAGTGVALLLDIKESSVLSKPKILRLTEEYNASLNVIIGPRNLEDLRCFRALNPNLRTLGFIKEIEDLEPFVQAGVDIIRLWPEWIYENPDLIERLHRRGKPVWTTAGPAPRQDLERLIQLGVNGILSDLPLLMKELRADHDSGRQAPDLSDATPQEVVK